MKPGSRQEPIPGGWLPTRQQEILLRAALLPPARAEFDWKAWCQQVDLENDYIDSGSFRLFPMVYRNLAQHNASLPEMSRLAGVYRKSWYRNQMISRSCSILLKQLKQAGIESLLLKGLALSQLYYHDMGARPMSDADILIPGHQLDDAVDLLTEKGWVPTLHDGVAIKDYFDIRHALQFKHQQKIEVDIHARVFFSNYSDALTDDIWHRAVPLTYNGIQVKTLTPEYHLIHTCAHALAWNPVSPIRWVADSMSILSHSRINWDLLVEIAIVHDLHGDIVGHLNYLKITWRQHVPDNVVERLQQAPSSRAKLKLYQNISRRPPAPLIYRASRLWAEYRYYCLSTGKRNHFNRLIDFPRYIMIQSELSGYWNLLEWGFSKLSVRTGEHFQRFLEKAGLS